MRIASVHTQADHKLPQMDELKSGKVSREEMQRIGSLQTGKGHKVRKEMKQLDVGEILLVLRKDWNWRYKTPNAIVNDMNTNSNKRFNCTLAANDCGWFIERIE